MRRVLGALVVVIAAVAAGLGISVAVHHRAARGGTQGASGPASIVPGTGVPGAGSATTAGPVEIVPGPGQTFVTGTVASLTADNAVGAPLTPPFTITIPSRGQGNADITGAFVGGRDVEIFWYGGQPLPVSGTGQLAIDGGAVSVDRTGTTWLLDGAPRSLTAGHFTLGAPVAVGSGGLATPHQSLAFDTHGGGTMQTTGHAQVHLAPAAVHLAGPGSVTLHGDFRIQTTATERQARTIVFGPGSYSIDLTPTASGDAIGATLQGAISFS